MKKPAIASCGRRGPDPVASPGVWPRYESISKLAYRGPPRRKVFPMVDLCSVPVPPLYNMGGGIPHQKSNLIPGVPSTAIPGWYLACDKLRLRFTTSIDCIPDQLIGCSFSEWRRMRNYGNQEIQSRKAWLLEGAVLLIHDRKLGCIIAGESLVVEFNPNRVGVFGCGIVGDIIRRCGFDAGRGVVERFDHCWTAETDPYALVLDSRHSKVDRYGCTAAGAETERVGYRKGCKRKLQRYDKSAEARSRGVDAPDGIARVEFTNWGVESPGTADDPKQLYFRDLEGVEWPAPDHYRVLRRKRRPAEFADELWQLFSYAAVVADPKAIRRLARKLLSGRTNDRAATAEMMLFDDLTPDLRRCFESSWRWVARSILGHVSAGISSVRRDTPGPTIESGAAELVGGVQMC